MRLFVGIELGDAMTAAAAASAERLQAALKRARLRVDARWVPAANLHVTLWFIGEVNDTRAEAIRRALHGRFGTPAFTLAAGGLGAFPPSGAPRVFWIGITAGVEAFAALYAEVAARLAPLGFEPERRAYSPHITIARVKNVRNGTSARVRGMLANVPVAVGSTNISAVTLFRSHVSSKGSTYEPLMRVPLA